jgi:YHS domain-containing protein
MARPQEAETGAKQIVAPQTRSRQANDVMSGKPVSTSIYADYAGKRIYFCCEESRRRFNTDPEAWMKAAREQGITLEDTPAKR